MEGSPRPRGRVLHVLHLERPRMNVDVICRRGPPQEFSNAEAFSACDRVRTFLFLSFSSLHFLFLSLSSRISDCHFCIYCMSALAKRLKKPRPLTTEGLSVRGIRKSSGVYIRLSNCSTPGSSTKPDGDSNAVKPEPDQFVS